VNPVAPVVGVRNAAPQAINTPSTATPLESRPPSASSASTMPINNGNTITKIHGASEAWARFSDPTGRVNRGHVNAPMPTADASTSNSDDRHRTSINWPTSTCQSLGHLGHRQPLTWVGGQDLGDLRREHR